MFASKDMIPQSSLLSRQKSPVVGAGVDGFGYREVLRFKQLFRRIARKHVVGVRPQPPVRAAPVDDERVAALFEDAARFGDEFALVLDRKEDIGGDREVEGG